MLQIYSIIPHLLLDARNGTRHNSTDAMNPLLNLSQTLICEGRLIYGVISKKKMKINYLRASTSRDFQHTGQASCAGGKQNTKIPPLLSDWSAWMQRSAHKDGLNLCGDVSAR